MSQSPLDAQADFRSPERESYEQGWVAIHRMLREGGSWSGRERNVCWLNLGAGRFADVSGVSGLDWPDDSRALARCDWDGDGDLDLWLAGRTTPRLRFLRNDVRSNGTFLQLALELANGADAIGARVELRLAGEESPRIDTVRAGDAYLAQSSARVHFGLAQGSAIDSVRVRWPDGSTEDYGALAAGRSYRLVAGDAQPHALDARSAAELPASEWGELESTARARVVLAARPFVPNLGYRSGAELDSSMRALTFERPTLVQFWADWCAPCKVELQRFEEAAPELRQSVDVVALSVDEDDRRVAAADWLESIDWSLESGFATESLLEFFDVVQQSVLERRRRLALPTSFLVDARGQIAVLYVGPVEPATVLADLELLELLELDPAALRSRAAASTGTWLGTPAAVDLARIEARLRERGLAAQADEYARRQVQQIESSPAKVHYEMGVVRQRSGDVDGAMQAFVRSLQIDPDFVDSQIGLAYLHQSRGEYGRAVELYRTALRRRADDRIALYNLALALAMMGRMDAAQVQLSHLREVDGTMAERCAADLERIEQR